MGRSIAGEVASDEESSPFWSTPSSMDPLRTPSSGGPGFPRPHIMSVSGEVGAATPSSADEGWPSCCNQALAQRTEHLRPAAP